MKKIGLLSIMAVAGSAVPALAQDSVSTLGGMPGDALEAGRTGAPYQKSSYVVDMTPLYGSWGTRFGVAPIIKLSSYENGFRNSSDVRQFNALASAQSLSQTILTGVPAASTSYRLWEVAGGGVHPQNNTAGQAALLGAGTSQFAATVAEFGTARDGGNNRNVNAIVTGVVNFDPANPSRLYVTRTVAAINLPAATEGDRSQFGVGAVDAAGNVTFRADNNAVTGTNAIVGNNYLRVRSLAVGALTGRSAASLNVIDNAGGSDASATDWVVQRSAATHNTPAAIPSDRATAPRGAVIGSNFNTNYVYESGPLATTETAAHRPGTADHRGGVSYSALRFFGANTAGTAAIITKTSTGSAQPSENISVWGVSGTGAPVNPVTIGLPRGAGATLNDACAELPSTPYAWDLGTGDFRHYAGTIAFRGGNGQVAMGMDQGGNALLAAEVSGAQSLNANNLPTDDSPHNAIAVYRFNPAQPTGGQWTVAAWTNPAGAFSDQAGKEIYGDYGNDGAPFTNDPGEFDGVLDLNPVSPTFDGPIGTMTSLFEVTSGSIIGPSISAPAFDSVGNIYFISAVRLYKSNGVVDTDSALLRAVYDQQNFCYRLELLMELGDTFRGENSATRYQIRFLNTAASNSRATPAGIWSNNGASYAWNNIDPTSIDSQDPKALGGLVLNAQIVYDVDNDGDFDSAVSDPTSPDEAYNVLLYVGNMDAPEQPGCPADFNGDGFLDFFDYDDYVNCFETGVCPEGRTADFNGDDFVDFFDYDDFVSAFEVGC